MSFWNWAKTIAGMAPKSAPVTGHPEPLLVDASALDIDSDGWLVGAHVERVPSVRHSKLTTPRGPLAIVWHYTATDVGTAKNLAKRIRTYKRGVDRAASWHVCIGADGRLWQSVSFERGSWHCAKGTILGHRVNACTVGVELEGHGKAFPDEQVDAAVRLVRALAEAYSLERRQAGYGHVMFDPSRRSDPGPVWAAMLPGLLERAYE